MKILIAGCGYVGTAVGRRWREKGHHAAGIRRSASGLESIRKAGIEALEADLLDPDNLRLPPSDVALLSQAPSGLRDDYRRTYLEGTRHFLRAAARLGLKKIVLVSSTSVYGINNGSWVDESTPPNPEAHPSCEEHEAARVLLDTEAAALDCGIPVVVLRLAGIYGPGRNAAERIRKGTARSYNPHEYTNRIRLEDIVAAIELLIEKGAAGEIYIGCDDTPVTQQEFYGWLYGRMKLPPPRGLAEAAPAAALGKRCSNRKIRELGLELNYGDYRLGYRDLV